MTDEELIELVNESKRIERRVRHTLCAVIVLTGINLLVAILIFA